MKTVLASAADSHSASRVGLCPPVFYLEAPEGGRLECKATPGQLALWEAWCTYWDKMKRKKKKLRAKLEAWHVGDGLDDAKNAKAELVSANKNDILRIAAQVFEPVVDAADEIYMLRGTEWHVGEAGWLDEQLAQKIGGVPSTDGPASWWVLRRVVEGIKIHATHHPPSRGTRPWTENNASSLSSANLKMRYADMGQECPDIALFGHVHFAADSGAANKPRVFYLPGWQMTTSFASKIGMAGIVRPVGGWWFVIENGQYTVEPEIWNWKKESVWSTS